MLSVTAAMGIGKLIGFGLIKLHDRICPYRPEPVEYAKLGSVSALFYDKDYIANLRILKS